MAGTALAGSSRTVEARPYDCPRSSGCLATGSVSDTWETACCWNRSDVDTWFAELDRFTDVALPDGRNQPPTPVGDEVFA